MLSAAALMMMPSAARLGAEMPKQRIAPPFPRIAHKSGHYEVLRGDFHMHSTHSDGHLTPPDRAREAWAYGYDVIAITDHRNFTAHDAALSTAESLGLILIRGMETGLHNMEHLVALDFSADYKLRNEHSWSASPDGQTVYYREQWRRLADAGAFVLYAHPNVGYRADGSLVVERNQAYNPPLRLGLSEQLKWGAVRDRGTMWYPAALDMAAEHGLAVFANSDVHRWRSQYDTGGEDESATLLLVTERSHAGVMEALRARRTVAHFGGMLAAPEAQARLLVSGMADVNYLILPENRSRVLISNRGPVPLSARMHGLEGDTASLNAYASKVLDLAEAPEELVIECVNVLVGSQKSLTTRHAPHQTADR